MKLSLLKYILLIFSIFTLQGCFSTVTDYENCVSEELIFEFKDDLQLYIIDDSEGTNKYTSMTFPKGEHYLCIGKDDACIDAYKDYSDTYKYHQGWKLIPVPSKPFHLTGKYKTNKPNSILGTFAPDTSALQAEIDGTKVWLSLHEFDNSDHKQSVEESIEKLKRNSELLNGWHLVFECPNTDVKEVNSELIW